MNNEKLADVIILGRGGGSLEDLWAFNEEEVARAIFESDIPIISAVGHETDFSISDFVADLRAPTPSAAAELAVPNIEDIMYTIHNFQTQLKVFLKKKVELAKLRYENCMSKRVFKEPLIRINEMSLLLDIQIKNIVNDINIKYTNSYNSFSNVVSKIDTLSPMKTLSRGYSITEKDGKIIKSIKDLRKDDEIQIRFADGNVNSKII